MWLVSWVEMPACWSLCHVRLKPETSASVALRTELVLVELEVVWLGFDAQPQLAAWPGRGDRMKQVITGMYLYLSSARYGCGDEFRC